MSQLTEIILKAGILEPETLREMSRWGLPLGAVKESKEYDAALTPAALSRAIVEAVESEGYVLTRETDLAAIPQYLQSMQSAVLRVVLDDKEHAEFEVQVGQTPTGEWIMPWRSDSITDLLANGETYLKVKGKRIYFSQARELFYGHSKAFIVCTPVQEKSNGRP